MNSNRHSIPLVLSFFTVGFIGILNHEIWGDEFQAWMIARDSSSIIHLFQNLRYEGHPGLWYLGLYLITRFTHNPLFMQIYHLFIATVTVYILAKFSPFTNLQKWLLAFGYLSLFEYCLISRDYAIGVLFVYVFCALFPYRQKGYLLLSLVLFLLSNTNIYGLIIAITLGLTLVFDYLLKQPKLPQKKWDIILSIFIFISGIIICLIQIIPPADADFASAWNFEFYWPRFTDSLYTLTRSYIAIPTVWEYNFWNKCLVDWVTGEAVFALISSFPQARFNDSLLGIQLYRLIISVSIIIFVIGLFWRKPVVLFMYTCGTLGILLFTYVKFFGYIRHHGHLFILLIACLWISHYYQESNFWVNFINLRMPRLISNFFNIHQSAKKYHQILFWGILFVNMVGGVFALSSDIVHPFSESKAVANFIRQQNFNHIPIIGSVDSSASTQAGYLDRKIYYPESDRLGTFIIWDDQRENLNIREVIESARKFVYTNSRDTLLLLNHTPDNTKDLEFTSLIPQYFNSSYVISNVKHFDESIMTQENFTLYMIKHK